MDELDECRVSEYNRRYPLKGNNSITYLYENGWFGKDFYVLRILRTGSSLASRV